MLSLPKTSAGPQVPDWSGWHAHFAANARRPAYKAVKPVRDTNELFSTRDLAPSARIALLRSLAIFQLGESGEGRITHEIDFFQAAGIDDDYRAALKYFVKEEGRHARMLAFVIRGLGGEPIGRNWTERLFHFGRRMMGVRLKMLVLLAAEIVGIVFYNLMARRLGGESRAILREIRADEIAHMHFHCDFFRTVTDSVARRFIFRWSWRVVYFSAALTVLLDHHRAFRLLHYSTWRLLGHWMNQGRRIEEAVLRKT